MTAVVANLVWASAAGIAIALVVAGAVAVIIRLQRPSATTRCALWFVALATCALAPLAIVGTMLVRGAGAPAATQARSAPSAHIGSARDDNAREDGARDDGRADAALAGGRTPGTAAAHAPLRALGGVTQSLRRPPPLTRTIARAIVVIWAAGALAGLIGLGRSLARVRSLKARSSPLEGALADELPWLTERAGREIYLRLSYEIETPIAIGFRRPVILIPTDMATDDGLAAIESLVMHEYAHLARYDDWSNLVQRLIERIVWFNPLVWIVGRRIALEREVAADDAVLARTNDAKDYASTLWRMAREMRMPEHVVVAPGAMLTRKQISIRIERLLEDSRARRPQFGTAFLIVAVGACTVAAVAATAPPIVLPLPAPAAVAVDITTPAPADASLPDAEPTPAPASAPHIVPKPDPAMPAAAPATAEPAAVANTPAPVTHAHGRRNDAALPSTPHQPQIPAIAWTPTLHVDPFPSDVEAHIADEAARAAASVKRAAAAIPRAVALAPHALPTGELTRADVAACRTCDFGGRDLSGLDLSHLDFYGANFDNADLEGVDFTGARLLGVSMRHTHLANANFTDARMMGSHLEGADMTGAVFTNARFVGSTIDVGALHANGSLRSMVDGCAGCYFSNADLHGQDLHGLRLDGADMQGADLHGANLRGAKLFGANFQDADLDHADLRDANLTGANLNGASMDGTMTTNAILTGATLP